MDRINKIDRIAYSKYYDETAKNKKPIAIIEDFIKYKDYFKKYYIYAIMLQRNKKINKIMKK